MGAVEQAVSTGFVGGGLHFDGLKLEAVSDVLGEYADTSGIDSFPRIDVFIEDD